MSSTPHNKAESARRATEADALQQVNALLIDTFENAGVGMAILGIDGRWLRVNQRFCYLVGRTCDALLAGAFQEITHPDDAAENLQAMRELSAGLRDSYITEQRYLHPDGHIIWVLLTVNPVRDTTGALRHFISVMQDITPRKLTEESLRLSESRYQGAFENAGVGMVQVALDGRLQLVNQRFCEMVGRTSEELLGISFAEITHPDDIGSNVISLQEFLDGVRTSNTLEKRYLRPDGGVVWTLVTASLVRDATGMPDHLLSIVQDITPRKLAEEALHERTEQLDSFFTLTVDLLCIADTFGHFLLLNPAWESVLGFTIPELKAGMFFDFVHPDDLQLTTDIMERLYSGEVVSGFVNRYRCKDGSYRAIEWRSRMAGDRIYAAAQDVTERRRVEAEMVRIASFPLMNPSPIVEVGLDDTVRFSNPAARALLSDMERLGTRHPFLAPLAAVREQVARGVAQPISMLAWVGDRCYSQRWSITLETGSLRIYSFEDTERVRAVEELSRLNDELEQRVITRTAELTWANEALHAETLQRLQAQRQLSIAILEERTRIAREIHDTLAQGFTGIVLQLEAALGAEREEADRHIRRAQELARRSLDEARRSVRALRPQALTEGDLASALASSVGELAQASQARFEFVRRGTPRRLPAEMEQHLLRLGVEAVTNAIKHARASAVRVHLAFDRDQVELHVEDDGEGFVHADDHQPRGFGLRGMAERVESLGGRLDIISRLGEGTRVVVSVPVPTD
jgi:PAS domain S-box-containing protein